MNRHERLFMYSLANKKYFEKYGKAMVPSQSYSEALAIIQDFREKFPLDARNIETMMEHTI